MLYGELPEVKIEGGAPLRGLTVRVPGTTKTAVLGLPTAQQMLDRLAKQRSIRQSVGRRQSQTEPIPNPEADLALFRAIRLDSGEEFDEWEAANAVSKLVYCEVTDSERAGEQYRITLKTIFGETVHTVNIPMQKAITLYRRSVLSVRELPHGREELRYRVEPAVTLYDSVAAGIEGYAASYKPSDVPPHHKSAAVVELVQAIDDIDIALDPNS